jgi:exopolysaccharide biosynthesis polyprenyl glycosylphosphotransferase
VAHRSTVRMRERLLIIGMVPLTEQIIRDINAQPGGRRLIVGVLDDAAPSSAPPAAWPLVEPTSRLAEIVEEAKPDRVLVALGERRRRTPIRTLLESCVARGIAVEDAAEFYERLTGKLAIESLTPTSIVFSRRFGPSRCDQAVNRVLSLLVAAVGLVVLSPLLALIALAVKLESAGPVLFVQSRIGVRGQPFSLLKFRTMRPAGERCSEWECDNRDRVTRVGRWLRAFRLDELPQFINVLRGEMNLVGPRPHPVSNLELFTLVSRNLNELTGSAIGYYTLRTMVRPGITGWAQVRYQYANNLEEEIEKLRYDLFYVKYASTALDLRVLVQTIKVILLGHASMHASIDPPARAPAAPLPAPADAAAPLGLPADVTRAHAA